MIEPIEVLLIYVSSFCPIKGIYQCFTSLHCDEYVERRYIAILKDCGVSGHVYFPTEKYLYNYISMPYPKEDNITYPCTKNSRYLLKSELSQCK